MATSPVFSEVIDVSFDQAGFAASISQLIEAWQNGLAEMSSKGVDTSSIGSLQLQGLTDGLDAAKERIDNLRGAFAAAFEALAAQSQQSAEQVEATQTSAASAVAQSWTKSSAVQLNQLAAVAKQSDETLAAFISGVENAVAKGADFGKLDFVAQARVMDQLTESLKSGYLQYDQLTVAQQRWYQSLAQVYGQAEQQVRQFASQEVAQIAEAWDRAIAEDEKWVQSRGKLISQAEAMDASRTAKIEAEAEKQAQAEIDAEERAASQRQAIIEKRDLEEATLRGKVMQAEQDAADAEVEAQQKAAERIQAIVEKRDLEEAVLRGKRMKAEEEAAAEQVELQKKAAEQQSSTGFSSVGSKFSGAFEDFGGQVAQMAALEVSAVAAGAAVSALVAPFVGIGAALKEGVSYLTQLEDATANLQGLLATNVKFAGDTATNFQVASVAARALHQEFEDAAIQYGLSVDTITRGFKSFVDNGGASLTSNIEEAGQAAVLFAAALKAAGKDAEATRSLLSEVPKLLDNTATSSSKILETLNISVDQWNAIVKQAQEHHDLLQQLTPLLSNYVQVAEQSRDRFSAISDELKLIYDRSMAIVAQGLWDVLKDVLEEIRNELEQNKTSIEAFGSFLSSTIKDAIVAVGDLLKAFYELGGGKQVIQTLGSLFVGLVYEIRQAADSVIGFSNILKALSDVHTANGPKETAEAWRGVTDEVQRYFSTLKDNTTAAKELEDRIWHGTGLPTSTQSTVPDGQGTRGTRDDKKTHQHADRLSALQYEYELSEKYLTQEYEARKRNIQLELADRLISQQQAAAQQKQIDDEEYQAQLNLIGLYKGKAAAYASTHNVDAKTLQTFDLNLDNKGETYSNQASKAQFEQVKKSIEEQKALQDKFSEDAISQSQKAEAAELQTLKEAGEKKVILQSDAYGKMLEVARVAYEQQRMFAQDELANAGADPAKQEAARNQMASIEARYTSQVQQFSDARKAALLSEYSTSQEAGVASARSQAASLELAISGNIRLGETALEAAQKQEALANAQLAVANALVQAKQNEVNEAIKLGLSTQKQLELTKQLEDAKAGQAKAQAASNRASQQTSITADPIGVSLTDFVQSLEDVFGDATNSFKEFGSDFAFTIQNFGTAISTLQTSVSGIENAFDKGGLLGGSGAIASTIGGVFQDKSLMSGFSKAFGQAFSAAPVVGGILSAAGGLFTSIASLFTARAQEIADDISKTFKNTVNQLNLGTATISATITQLQQQRANAIAQLSGVKGGQDQLNKLLPEFDQEIAQLQKQAADTKKSFESALDVLQAGGSALQDWVKSWQDINTQVQQYLDAGGDVAKANQFLSDTLANMVSDLNSKLADGDQTAIEDAINLNSLYQQRIALIKQEQETEFGIQTKDAVERRTSTGVQTASDLATQRASFQQQLSSLLDQISLTQQKVDLESQVFDLAKDTASLQAESNALTLASLQQQLEQYQEMASIIKNTSGLQFAGTPNTSSTPGVTIGSITISTGSGTLDKGTSNSAIAVSLSNAIYQKLSSLRTGF